MNDGNLRFVSSRKLDNQHLISVAVIHTDTTSGRLSNSSSQSRSRSSNEDLGEHSALPACVYELMFKLPSLRRTGFELVRFSAASHASASLNQINQRKSLKPRRSKRQLPIARSDYAIMPKAPKNRRKGTKFYAVRVGRTPGVYESWDDAEAQVRQKAVMECLADEQGEAISWCCPQGLQNGR